MKKERKSIQNHERGSKIAKNHRETKTTGKKPAESQAHLWLPGRN
jgi:hypothetical protein